MSSRGADCPSAGFYKCGLHRPTGPNFPLCCNLPQEGQEPTLGDTEGGCFGHFSLLLPLDLVPPRDRIPPRSRWDCRTVEGRSRLPQIAGPGPQRGRPTASEPDNSVKLCHIESHLNASIYVTASWPPRTDLEVHVHGLRDASPPAVGGARLPYHSLQRLSSVNGPFTPT